jgi:ATP-dependent Clp protease adaptor protein ClpS
VEKGGRSHSERPPFLRHFQPALARQGIVHPLSVIMAMPYLSAAMTMDLLRITAGDDDRSVDDRDGDLGVATKTRTRTKTPSPYKVLMLNDDYTPMEFVVHVLQSIFKMGLEDATRVMLHVHQRGVGVCGIFPYEIAETKVAQVIDFARENQHPLQCTLEKA